MADKMTVRIFHNENERESFSLGYSMGDPLVEVYRGEHRLPYTEPQGIGLTLEHIFEENQWTDRKRPWYDEARSLCVGDIIALNDKAYACLRGVGFTEVVLEEAGIPCL